MKPFLKTKRMRQLLKEYSLNEKRSMKKDGVWRIQQNLLCSECTLDNCICRDNAIHKDKIELYRKLNTPIALTAI